MLFVKCKAHVQKITNRVMQNTEGPKLGAEGHCHNNNIVNISKESIGE